MNPVSLIGANLFAYAEAWRKEHGREFICRSLMRAWQLHPQREQWKREQQERAALAMGFG